MYSADVLRKTPSKEGGGEEIWPMTYRAQRFTLTNVRDRCGIKSKETSER